MIKRILRISIAIPLIPKIPVQTIVKARAGEIKMKSKKQKGRFHNQIARWLN